MTFHRMDNFSKQVVFTNNSLRREGTIKLAYISPTNITLFKDLHIPTRP